jgi:hypothetical protein
MVNCLCALSKVLNIQKHSVIFESNLEPAATGHFTRHLVMYDSKTKGDLF